MRQHHSTGPVHVGPISAVVLPCSGAPSHRLPAPLPGPAGDRAEAPGAPAAEPWQVLAEWVVPSAPGNERLAMGQVAAVVEARHLPARRLERLKTAVAEATMNAMEHGNGFQAAAPVRIRVLASVAALAVWITDQGGRQARPAPIAPDLEAKLAGLQTPRGWGLFLMEHLVDEMHERNTGAEHTVELILYGHDVPAARTPAESVPTTEAHDRDRKRMRATLP